MKKTIVLAFAASCLFLAFGCGASRMYTLPYPSERARDTFTFLRAAADQMGLKNYQHPDSVQVTIDELSNVMYKLFDKQYQMFLMVDDKKVPADQLENKFAQTKQKGDEIWQKAMDLMRGAPIGLTTPLMPPAVAVNSKLGPECQKLSACYAAIANSLCTKTSDASCSQSFNFKMSVDDPGMCQQALKDVPMLTTPYQTMIQGWRLPAECQ